MKPCYIDIHAHTNFAVFDADRAEVVNRAIDAGVWMINVGTGAEMSRKAVDMTREFPEGVYAIVGLHPIHVMEEELDIDAYRKLVAEAPHGKVVGIGECGLDYFHHKLPEERDLQKKVFLAQIELALELDLPLMLHIRSGEDRDAYRDVLDILKPYKAKHGDKLRGDTHFFAGSVSDLREFIDMGFYVSFTGVVTFAKQYKELVEAAPADRIMSETDCPYVAPVPERGKRCEPSFVVHTAEKIITIQGANPEEGRKQIVENAFRLWRLG